MLGSVTDLSGDTSAALSIAPGLRRLNWTFHSGNEKHWKAEQWSEGWRSCQSIGALKRSCLHRSRGTYRNMYAKSIPSLSGLRVKFALYQHWGLETFSLDPLTLPLGWFASNSFDICVAKPYIEHPTWVAILTAIEPKKPYKFIALSFQAGTGNSNFQRCLLNGNAIFCFQTEITGFSLSVLHLPRTCGSCSGFH